MTDLKKIFEKAKTHLGKFTRAEIKVSVIFVLTLIAVSAALYIEKDFSAEEQKRIEKEQEIRELKLKKKRESRV